MMSSNQDKLQELFFELENWISCLKDFTKEHEVNSRCDLQERQIQLTFATLAEHLKKAEAKHLDEINAYRQATLDAILSSSSSNENDKLAKEISALFADVNAFYKRETIEQHESIKENMDDLFERVHDLKRRQRSAAFQGRFLQFIVNPMLEMPGSLPGRIRYFCCEPKHKLFTTTIEKLLSVLRSPFPVPCVKVMFLKGGNLLLSSSEGHIAAFSINPTDPSELRLVSEMKPSPGCITAVAEYQPGRFVIAYKNQNECMILQPDRSEVGSLVLHSRDIISFQIIRNGIVASLSMDNTIAISDIIRRCVLRRMTGHGCTQINCQMGKLSNQWLVTCSNDSDDCMLRVWDPEDGKLVLEKPAGLKQVCALAVLSDDRVAIASLDGSLKIISLVGDSLGKLLIGPKQQPNHTSFIEVLVNDDILISDSSLERPHLQVWDSVTGELVQSIDSEHTGQIISAHLCPKKEKLVTVSIDGSVRTWMIQIDIICLTSKYNK